MWGGVEGGAIDRGSFLVHPAVRSRAAWSDGRPRFGQFGIGVHLAAFEFCARLCFDETPPAWAGPEAHLSSCTRGMAAVVSLFTQREAHASPVLGCGYSFLFS